MQHTADRWLIVGVMLASLSCGSEGRTPEPDRGTIVPRDDHPQPDAGDVSEVTDAAFEITNLRSQYTSGRVLTAHHGFPNAIRHDRPFQVPSGVTYLVVGTLEPHPFNVSAPLSITLTDPDGNRFDPEARGFLLVQNPNDFGKSVPGEGWFIQSGTGVATVVIPLPKSGFWHLTIESDAWNGPVEVMTLISYVPIQDWRDHTPRPAMHISSLDCEGCQLVAELVLSILVVAGLVITAEMWLPLAAQFSVVFALITGVGGANLAEEIVTVLIREVVFPYATYLITTVVCTYVVHACSSPEPTPDPCENRTCPNVCANSWLTFQECSDGVCHDVGHIPCDNGCGDGSTCNLLPTQQCPNGPGSYCGDEYSNNRDVLYQCAAGDHIMLERCTYGCVQDVQNHASCRTAPPPVPSPSPPPPVPNCVEGAQRHVTCGNCGAQLQQCSQGNWTNLNGCGGQGTCWPASQQNCPNGDVQTCTTSCAWTACPEATPGVTPEATPTGHCGNGTCDSDENCGTCFNDCPCGGQTQYDFGPCGGYENLCDNCVETSCTVTEKTCEHNTCVEHDYRPTCCCLTRDTTSQPCEGGGTCDNNQQCRH